jgi:hypothetical protein
VIGDANVFGRVSLSTAGRSIVFGELVQTSSTISSGPWGSSVKNVQLGGQEALQ